MPHVKRSNFNIWRKSQKKSPAISLHVFRVGPGVVDSLYDAELEVVVGEFGVADDSREGADFVVELGNGVAAFEGETQRVQVLLRVFQHLKRK